MPFGITWTKVALLGAAGIIIGTIVQTTKAGEGLRQLGGGLGELVAAPIREGARAFGEVGLGIQQFGGGIGGAFIGIREEIQKWIDMINAWQGVKPPYIEPGGCRPPLEDGSCPTDQAYERVNGECCWGKSLEEKRQGARTTVLPPAPVLPIPPAPIVSCTPNPSGLGGWVRSDQPGIVYGQYNDCEASAGRYGSR